MLLVIFGRGAYSNLSAESISALVGMAVIVIGMYVPGIIAKRTHAVQVALSKAVCSASSLDMLLSNCSHFCPYPHPIQTDERVQIVSESQLWTSLM